METILCKSNLGDYIAQDVAKGTTPDTEVDQTTICNLPDDDDADVGYKIQQMWTLKNKLETPPQGIEPREEEGPINLESLKEISLRFTESQNALLRRMEAQDKKVIDL